MAQKPLSHSLGGCIERGLVAGERRCSCYERHHSEYMLKANSTVKQLGFEMAKRAKADQLGTGTQGLCCKPLRQARPWPERKSAPAPSRGATLTANTNERTQPANRGQMVEGQGFRPSCADKVARRRLSNRPNLSGLKPRGGSSVVQLDYGTLLLAAQMHKRTVPVPLQTHRPVLDHGRG